MKRWMLLGVFGLVGCGVLVPRPHNLPPQEARVCLAVPADTHYTKAYRTFVSMPTAVVRSSNSTLRSFSGQLHNAVEMTVLVEASAEGSCSMIQGHVPTGKLVRGTFTEVNDYAQLLREGK